MKLNNNIIPYLSCPDLHTNPAWMDTMKLIFLSILRTAKKEKVKFVLFPGDFWDKAVFATEEGGLNIVIKFIMDLKKICPVVAIEGTITHDQKGCYGALMSAGLVLALPGIPYGLINGEIKPIDIEKPFDPEVLIFGIPEPNIDVYQAKHKELDWESVCGAITAGIDYLCESKIAPIRGLFPDVPAIGMIHGTISDAMDRASETDIIRKSSAVITKTDTLKKANLDRIEAGHLHGRWESKKINCGYAGFAGIDRNPWAPDKRDKIPSMNLGKIDGHNVTVTPVPYGTPMRVKISEPLEWYDPNIAYWLHTKDRNAVCPVGHDWNKLDFIPEEQNERDINIEAVQNAQTLRDLAELYDPELPESILKKFDIISEIIKPRIIYPRKFELLYVEVLGCTFWKGKPMRFNLEDLPNGPTQIIGKNGDGKSGGLGWCQPYPCFIGKDTDSGHVSAIKDFFQEKISGINKRIRFNGEIHEHTIVISGAHTQNPSVKCTLTINGEPVLTDCKFKPMMEKCEELYGSMADYIMTTFYVQPLQGAELSGLMTATMTSIQSLVQKIAGIDYSLQKEFALEKIREITNLIQEERFKIDADEEALDKVEDVELEIKQLQSEIVLIKDDIEANKDNVKSCQRSYDEEKLKFDRMNEQIKNKNLLKEKKRKTEASLSLSKETLVSYSDRILEMERAKETLESDKTTKNEYQDALIKRGEIAEGNNKLKDEYNKKISRKNELESKIENLEFQAAANYQKSIAGIIKDNNDIDKKVLNLESEIQTLNQEIDNIISRNKLQVQKIDIVFDNEVSIRNNILSENKGIDRLIESMKKPCPNCGFIDPEILKKIEDLEKTKKDDPGEPIKREHEPILFGEETGKIKKLAYEIVSLKGDIKTVPKEPTFEIPEEIKTELEPLKNIQTPVYTPFTMPDQGLSEERISLLEKTVASGTHATADKKTYEEKIIPEAEARILELTSEIEAIIIDFIDISLKEGNLEEAKNSLKEINDKLARREEAIKINLKKIETIKEKLILIAERRDQILPNLVELEEWKKVSELLLTTKIPAFELETFLETINDAATEYIEPYREGIYMFHLENQKNTKTKTIDKFDVKIHDGLTGKWKSFLKFSVGEKSFQNDALTKALTKVRLNRMKTSYSPAILDEPDSFIDKAEIPTYHAMQKRYYSDSKVIIVSHQPEVETFIESKINMKGLIG